jgi:hypothetical protein
MLKNSSLSDGAGNAIGTHQRPPVDFETDHGELTAAKSEPGVAGRREAEEAVCPMGNRQHDFAVDSFPRICSRHAGSRSIRNV